MFLTLHIVCLHFWMATVVFASEKRLVVDEIDVEQELLSLKATIGSFQNNLTALEKENANLKKQQTVLQNQLTALTSSKATGHSSVYIHWGRTQCPGNSTELVYRGFTSGGHFTDGSGASLECLPEHPTWNRYDDNNNTWRAYIYGAEIDQANGVLNHALDSHDMPCAVCRTPFSVTHMFPGTASCYRGWTKQYTGYLVSSSHGRSVDMEYYCLDANPETVPHGEVNRDQCVLYLVEAKCGSLPCPPYVEGREIACTVCSK